MISTRGFVWLIAATGFGVFWGLIGFMVQILDKVKSPRIRSWFGTIGTHAESGKLIKVYATGLKVQGILLVATAFILFYAVGNIKTRGTIYFSIFGPFFFTLSIIYAYFYYKHK